MNKNAELLWSRLRGFRGVVIEQESQGRHTHIYRQTTTVAGTFPAWCATCQCYVWAPCNHDAGMCRERSAFVSALAAEEGKHG
jgi:hypothetical protein